ncbi:MAG: DUF4349 domain-containing protein [Gammaproteobacteria bacterium]|nr:DUF4349 domain-containing protein [Gammaproteobacteria bacterium]
MIEFNYTVLLKVILAITMSTFISSCASYAPSSSASRQDLAYAESGTETRMVTKQGSMEIEVEEIKSLDEKIRLIVKDKSGYVASSQLDSSNRYYSELKIPSKELENTINQIAGLGKEVSRNISTTDVTDVYIDTEAELKNLESLRTRMRELLARATNVEEILKVENELNRIQTRIDTISARLKSLNSQLVLSTLNVTASEKRIYGPIGYLGMGIYWVIEKLFVIK